MYKRKVRKIKYKKILKLMIVLIVIFILINIFVKLITKKDFTVVLDNSTFNFGDNLDTNFKAYYKKQDVTNDVQITNNYSNELGTYKLIFTYKNGEKEYKVTKNIKIQDMENPTITLKGNDEITIIINSTYNELGYLATDNYDGDITSKVKVSGNVDVNKEGTYTLTYDVKDTSGNKTSITRKVIVTANSPLNLSLKDFTLDGLFTNTILQKTDNAGDDYIDDIIFAGDSMALYYVINQEISGKQLWHQVSINPETALTSKIYINHQESGLTFVEAFAKNKPKMVIMTLGTNSAGFMTPSYFISNYTKLINEIKNASPDTKLIIQSIPPVDGSYDQSDKAGVINNDKINKMNYYIAEMCNNLGVKFLNSAPAMKDANGACKEGFCRTEGNENGIHPTKAGNDALIEYAKTHAYQS